MSRRTALLAVTLVVVAVGLVALVMRFRTDGFGTDAASDINYFARLPKVA